MEAHADPLTSLLVNAVTVDREQIAKALAGRVAIDRDTATPVLMPGYATLDSTAKLLALLLARRAAELLGLVGDAAVSPTEAARQTGMPGGTVRRMLPELVEGHRVTRAAGGGYHPSSAQVPSAIDAVERITGDDDTEVRQRRSSKPRKRGRTSTESESSESRRSASSSGSRSPSNLVKELIETGFFVQPRTLSEVQLRLKHNTGHDIPTSTLSPVFTRLLRAVERRVR